MRLVFKDRLRLRSIDNPNNSNNYVTNTILLKKIIDPQDFHLLVAILLGAISLIKINQQFAIITIPRSITIAFASS